MKKLLSVLLVFAIVLSFTACEDKNSAKYALNKGLEAFKDFDIDGISKYVANSALTEEELNAQDTEEAKAIFSTLSWKIKSCKEEGDKAVATVELTCVSLAEAVKEVVSEMMNEMFAGNVSAEDSDEYAVKKLSEKIKDPKAKRVTQTVAVELEKIDGQWKISNPAVLISVMSFGLEGILPEEK